MISAIGDILPLAVAIGISPFPIVAVVLALLSPAPKRAGVAFAVGWFVGLIGLLLIVLAVAIAAELSNDGQPGKIIGGVRIALGIALVALAVRQWLARPRAGEEPPTPRWLAMTDGLTPAKSLGLGFAIATVNPKGLFITIAAGLALERSGLRGTELIVPAAVFVVIASAATIILLGSYLLMPERMDRPLLAAKSWLIANNAVIMTVILLIIGVMVFSKGLHSF